MKKSSLLVSGNINIGSFSTTKPSGHMAFDFIGKGIHLGLPKFLQQSHSSMPSPAKEVKLKGWPTFNEPA